jgi:P4 family phage/plasmid primase-like protien
MNAASQSANEATPPKKSIVMRATNLENYLKQKSINKEVPQSPTNTRIGDKKKESKIYGGSYHIPSEEYNTKFLPLYAEKVFKKREPEYLTEKQLDTDGPIYIDMDLHFKHDVGGRLIDKDYIDDLMDTYLDELKNMFQFDDEQHFDLFIMQKPSVNRLADGSKTKDGLHIMICFQADRVMQIILRDRVMKQIAEKWDNLPIINKWDDVFDEGITIGYTNCQLYGSRKPDNEAYAITYAYDIVFDKSDGNFQINPVELQTFDIVKNIHKLSVRHSDIPVFFMKNEFATVYNEYKRLRQGGSPGGNKTSSVQRTTSTMQFDINSSGLVAVVRNIKSPDDLDLVLNQFLDTINKNEYDLREAHEYAMTLPVSYYGEGSYMKWMKVGWALKNIDDKLLISWIKFSSQSKAFKYVDIPDLCDRWMKMNVRKFDGVTKRSLMHWSKQDAYDKYIKVREDSIDHAIELTITGTSASMSGDSKMSNKGECGDFDLAKVLYILYKDEFVCTSVKSNIWYQYIKNRWIEIDSGTTLRKAISTEMRELYNKKTFGQLSVMMTVTNNPASAENDDEQTNIRKIRSQRILNICQRLNRTSDKKNIMTEAKELFYDGNFMDKLDTNPNLMCFNNGVIDFKEKIFRNGRPEDCLSLCTNTDYYPLDRVRDAEKMKEIEGFLRTLFPDNELYNYMFDHLASTLMGTTSNQTFNMYIGAGSNGKSKLVDFMKIVLGKYKGDVPLSLVTGDRTKIGGLSPEVVQLKGVRFAVMQEPSKGDRINEGKMKELTGGDTIQARAPYQLQAISFTPQFKLVVCSNTMMEIKSNDHGTWRRIRVVQFKSLFTETPVFDDPEKPYQFKIIKNIEERFDDWKEVFTSMLVERAFETNGNVKDCNMVMAASNEYRESQDYISEFIRDKIVRDVDGKIKKTELNNEFQKWYMATYGRGGPNVKDVHDFIDKQFGKQKNQVWKGIKINYERDEFEMPNVNPDEIDVSDLDA